ncbi:MAG: glycine cleavage system protein GcvH [Propionibacteriaceae bacterium]|jgi:glycine cleavage system H protein|nr:glycine cleavage system protein GcvH [Propionibacteriaceae bacterium]
MTEFPADLKYTADHEWIKEGPDSILRIGITAYAADALGDIVFVSTPTIGDTVGVGDSVVTLESTKSVSEVYSPVDGVISLVNDGAADNPEIINADPYGSGWLFEIQIAQRDQLAGLLDADTYASTLD